jgi:hypothetical protein
MCVTAGLKSFPQRSFHKQERNGKNEASIQVAKQVYQSDFAATDLCGVI